MRPACMAFSSARLAMIDARREIAPARLATVPARFAKPPAQNKIHLIARIAADCGCWAWAVRIVVGYEDSGGDERRCR